MDVTLLRDWVIIVYGILSIVLIITFSIAILVIYNKVNHLVKKGKQTVMTVENAFTSPYYKAGSWLFRCLATGLGIFSKGESQRRNE